jgi:hypothetical protein
MGFLLVPDGNSCFVFVDSELDAGRVDPEVGSGWVQIFVSSGGSGGVGSRNLNIFIYVFRKLQKFSRTEKL